MGGGTTYEAITDFAFPAGLLTNGPIPAIFAGNDSLKGWSGAETLDGGDGHDMLDGGGSNDFLSGSAGSDVLHGGEGDDIMVGGDNDFGSDLLDGGAGNDLAVASRGNCALYGGAGNDRLDGSDGNDVLDGGPGADEMEGGFGDDTYVLRAGDGGTRDLPDLIVANFSQGTDTIRIIGLRPEDVWIGATLHPQPALRFALKGADGSLTYTDVLTFVEGADRPGVQHLGKVVFDNGTVWDLAKGLPRNAFPHGVDDAYVGQPGKALTVDAAHGVLANDTDGNGSRLSASLFHTTSGEFSLNADGSFSYMPAMGFTGVDRFAYYATHLTGSGNSASDGLSISSAPSGTALTEAGAATDLALQRKKRREQNFMRLRGLT